MVRAMEDGRITDVPYDPALPVHTAWDLGIGDATAIWWWQITFREIERDGKTIREPIIRVIDHYECTGQALPHYASVCESKGYNSGEDWVPHDARVRELGTGRTRVETLASLRRKPRLVPDSKREDRINAARLSFDRCWFDAKRCALGLEALRQYQTEYDEDKKTFKDNPLRNWATHSADAFTYMTMAWRELQKAEAPANPIADLLRRKTIAEMVEETFEHENEDRDHAA